MSKSVLGWAIVIVRGEKSWFLSLVGFDEDMLDLLDLVYGFKKRPNLGWGWMQLGGVRLYCHQFGGPTTALPFGRECERGVPPLHGLAAALVPRLLCPYHRQQHNMGSLSEAACLQHPQTVPICPSFIP